MKRFRPLKIFISFFTIFTLSFGGFFGVFAPRAYAQQIGGGGGAGFNVTGIAGSVLQCTGMGDKLQGALGNLFGGKGKGGEKPGEGENSDSTTSQAGGLFGGAGASAGQTVPVKDSTVKGEVSKVKKETEATKKEEQKDNNKERCLDGIVHNLAVGVMDKITLATVDWINSGFEGQPFYISDPDTFFSNIAKEQINGFTGWYSSDLENYPFGQIVMGSILTSLQTQANQNLKYSLNQVLAHGTSSEFYVDFNIGGWAGLVDIASPNNNPVGSYLLASQELGRRIDGTSINVAADFKQQLSQSGGFLNQRKCVATATGDPSDTYIPATDEMHVPSGGPIPDALYNAVGLSPGDTPNENQQATIDEYTLRSRCTQWETQTPGKTISEQLTKSLNISTDQLLLADEFNEDLALILDALINQLVNTGLRSLQPSSSGGNSGNNVLLAQVNGEQPGQVQNGAQPPLIDQVTGTGYSSQSLFDIQQLYIPLAQQALPVVDRVVRKINALDYCVPGPNPNWQELAQSNFVALVENVPFHSGYVVDSDGNYDANATEQDNQNYYAQAIQSITGITISNTQNMHNHEQFLAFMDNLFTSYRTKMLATYSPTLAPPAVRIFLSGLFDEKPSFESEASDLSTYLVEISSYLGTLESAQNALEQLAANNGGVLDQNDPQVQIQLSLVESIQGHFATEAELQNLQNNYVIFQNKESTLDQHLASCILETVTNNSYQPDYRKPYPENIYPWPGLPGPDQSFLTGGQFTNNNNGNNVDASMGGQINIQGGDFTTFETMLQSIY